ncbi:hypothetical protein LO763_21990 [Glycomyces sp. A-F 0318]|uniref:DddA-like double-stranded DNA deaminase toxin n=1 Tax=Glycomyces amatae TaxID=2881355 RepID=UPI001E3385AE|nr:DddA-like double-stranded DNA deaminase toxin [Glycomyces amatae]MCD0446288.1 hypothetical protein [Glycomyces amatae]
MSNLDDTAGKAGSAASHARESTERLGTIQADPDEAARSLTAVGNAANACVAESLQEDFDPRPYFADMPRWKSNREFRRGEPRNQRTHGRRVGSDQDREWVSGEDDRYARRAQERWEREEPGGPDQMQTFPVAGHVEIKFAEYMRERELTEERIVINNPNGPCPVPLGCERFLPWILGPGRTLTVDYPGGTRTFIGTGTIE